LFLAVFVLAISAEALDAKQLKLGNGHIGVTTYIVGQISPCIIITPTV
jgi:hypothetical protein